MQRHAKVAQGGLHSCDACYTDKCTWVTVYGLGPKTVMTGGTVSAAVASVANEDVTLTAGTRNWPGGGGGDGGGGEGE